MRFSLFATLASLAFCHAGTYRGIKDDWSFDLGVTDLPDWMSTILDSVPLPSLSIPGTHSSMTDKMENVFLQTQNAPLDKQLASGIRYIDITCRLKDVLTTMFDFLDSYPSEAVILRIQKGGVIDDSKAFLDSMKTYFEPGSSLGDRALQHVYFRDPDDTTIPTLGQVRGKVLILQDFKTVARYGIPWNSKTVSSYNNKVAASNALLSWYWPRVKSHISRSPTKDVGKLRITHTNAGFGVKPINMAAGDNDSTAMNEYLGGYLLFGKGDSYGIVAMDFPNDALVQVIVKLNYQHLVSTYSSGNYGYGLAS